MGSAIVQAIGRAAACASACAYANINNLDVEFEPDLLTACYSLLQLAIFLKEVAAWPLARARGFFVSDLGPTVDELGGSLDVRRMNHWTMG